jgi:hypothetical protein
MESKSVQLIRDYFLQIGIEKYTVRESSDGGQDIIFISMPSEFNPGLKRLLGKGNRDLAAFKIFLKNYGTGEGRNNFIVLKLTHDNGKKEYQS